VREHIDQADGGSQNHSYKDGVQTKVLPSNVDPFPVARHKVHSDAKN